MFRIILCGALLVLGQQPPQQPTFRSATELVEVDVRVVDKDGRFVTTLTADDFVLAEDGVPQPIDVVYLVTGGAAALVPRRSVAAAAPAPAIAHAPLSRHTWIFVFDTPHLSPAGLKRTRDAVRNFMKERFRDGDLGGIVGDRGMVNGRLTSDRDELERAAGSISTATGRRQIAFELREWPRVRDELEALQIARDEGEALQTAVMRACNDEPALCRNVDTLLMEKARRIATEIRTSTLHTMSTLTALTRGLARIPGPKNIVLLSEGFISEQMESHVQTVVGHAGVAGARVYSIDARGLARGGVAEIMDARLADSPIGALGSGRDMHTDGTNALAIDTGGFAIRNENNFGRALDLIDRDSGTYYVLGYRPASVAYDGKFHRIDVRVNQPGLKVRARRGYLALEPARLLRPAPSESGSAAETADTTANAAGPRGTAPLSQLPEIPRVRPPIDASGDVVRKVLELAREASAMQRPGNAAAGWAAYQRGDVATAATELGAAVAHGDTRAWVHYALGFATLAQGRPKEAVEAWEQVRAAAPEYQETYFDLADAYLQLRDTGAAIAVLREAEKRWPADAEVYNALGVVQIGRGALDDAVESFGKAVKVAPDESLGYLNLGRAYSMRFFKSQRYSRSRGTWVSNARDRALAAAQFEKYIAIGGPYVQDAQTALAALAWK